MEAFFVSAPFSRGSSACVLPWLMLYVSQHFPDVYGGASTLTKYGAAMEWIEERMPCLKVKGSAVSAAATVFLCAIAQDAWEVSAILAALVRPRRGDGGASAASGKEATELLYCAATAFLMDQRRFGTSCRRHFCLAQALYFFETSWNYDAAKTCEGGGGGVGGGMATAGSSTKSATKQPTLFSFKGFTTSKQSASHTPTAEQVAITTHPIVKGTSSVVKIVAFAGTGKTSTLVTLCEKNPHLRFLVVMYNKAAKEHAVKIFPKSNVKCSTAHAMAMRKCGFKYSRKLVPNLRASDIIDADVLSKEKSSKDGNYHRRAAIVLKTMETFMNSPDREIESDHVPTLWLNHATKSLEPVDATLSDLALRDAKAAWEVMADAENDSLKIPHDGYLKVWQLAGPNLQYFYEHDVLLVDEAQDMNPAMLDIFLSQEAVPKIFVGDPNQQIYLFRGAVNALGKIEADKVFYLTQSFRFGPEIAYVANCWLAYVKGTDKRVLVGGRKQDDLVINTDDLRPGKHFGQVAVLTMTNARLFDEAVNRICIGDGGQIQRTGCFAGGFDNYNFGDLVQLYYLMSNQKEKMTKYKKFRTFDALKTFATNTADVQLMGKITTVEKYGRRLEGYVNLLRKHCRPSEKKLATVDYVFSTIHKSKGLEWDTVLLTNDVFSIEVERVTGKILLSTWFTCISQFGLAPVTPAQVPGVKLITDVTPDRYFTYHRCCTGVAGNNTVVK